MRLPRLFFCIACLSSSLAWSQDTPPALTHAPDSIPAVANSCPLQPHYPLPVDRSALEKLAESQQAVAGEHDCLKSAAFHAWRGATLLALGRAVEAVEPLERALLQDPDLPGAQLDLAQALAEQGDTASARSFLSDMRRRADLPLPIGSAIDRQLELLAILPQVAQALTRGWHSRWQFSALGGGDTNLNNAPASSEITLTFPQGNVTLPLDISSQPRRGRAGLAIGQWQGLRVQDDSLWVLQAELRARQTGHSDTNYQQADVAASWLQAPAAPRQWVARLAASHLRYGGSSLLQATRAALQYQWEARGRTAQEGVWADYLEGCRPAATLELEHRRYPSSHGLDGLYEGGAFGWLCRRSGVASETPLNDALAASTSFYSLQARFGSDHPLQDDRPGGAYRRAELKAQWDGPLLTRGRFGVQFTSTRQIDRQPYSVLLGNVPRHTWRNVLQLDASWPLRPGLSLVGNAEVASQRSNLSVFESSGRSVYVGLRWDVTQ